MLEINPVVVIALYWIHFISDFVIQNDATAKGKSDSWQILCRHSVEYSIPFIWLGWQFLVITCATHAMVDAVTSRIAKRYFLAERRHAFFVTIGADQAIHATILFLTLLFTQG
jgi:hypothetical protein